MPPCELCSAAAIARVAYLGGRSERPVWLCTACFQRHEDHELEPNELLRLARRTAEREGRCDWCAREQPVAQVQVRREPHLVLAFDLCAGCARAAREQSSAQVLHAEAAREDDVVEDEKLERAREIATRRRSIRRIK